MSPDANRREWEARASTYGSSPAGVLFKDFPQAANAALHAWHTGIIEQRLLSKLPRGASVLDLGCGYGRIATEIRKRRDDLRLVGQDISMSYCTEFAKRCGSVVQASLEAIPFAEGAFDAAIAITSLMYVDPARRGHALSGIGAALKDGGHVLLIDPGIELQKLVSAARGKGMVAPSSGVGFARAEYARLAENAGLEVCASGGNPAFTRRILLFGGRAARTWQQRALEKSVAADLKCDRDPRLPLHRWALLRKSSRVACNPEIDSGQPFPLP